MNLIDGGSLSRLSRYQQPPRKTRGGIPFGWSRSEPSPAIESRPDRVISIFERALAGPFYDANQQAWDEALNLLNLKTCYQPAVAKVLSEGCWRNKTNPRAYVATAAARQALKMRLPDFTDREFRRVASSNSSDDGPTVRQSISPRHGNDEDGEQVPDIIEGASSSGGDIYERTESGGMRWVNGYDDDDRQIPEWLARGEEFDTVDWETVAAYAALKPRMTPDLALALILRFELQTGRPVAIARVAEAEGKEKAGKIASAWKWIDRNWKERIAPLFLAQKPPRQLTETDIQDFPMLSRGVSLRLDTHIQWDGTELAMTRFGLTPDNEGHVPAYGIGAKTIEEAVQYLCAVAAASANPPPANSEPLEDRVNELFHVWHLDTQISPSLKIHRL